jgi:catechol 2,3-dioxygenase-like lactoylglutathione lyase family enzyme
MAIEVRGVAPLLQVYDMPASVHFYRDLLGFTLVTTSPPLGGQDRFHWCLLRLGSAEIMLNTAYEFDDERPAVPAPERVAAHDDTCLYFGCPDVDAAYEELRAKGVPVQSPRIASYGMRQMYLHDPDGFSVCFQWPAKN